MEPTTDEAVQGMHKGLKIAAIATAAIVATLTVAYLAVCGIATASDTIYPGNRLLGIDLGGLTQAQAAELLETQLPQVTLPLYLDQAGGKAEETAPTEPDATITLSDLGVSPQASPGELAALIYGGERAGHFFTNGFQYLQERGGHDVAVPLTMDETRFAAAAADLAKSLSAPQIDGSYRVDADSLFLTRAKDGLSVSADLLTAALRDAVESAPLPVAVRCPATVLTARARTAEDIHTEVAGDMKNAGFDAATGKITPERVGAEFDPVVAQAQLDAALPGTEVSIPATVQRPAVTAQQLEAVLFRDVLGSYTTHVGGSKARIGNVKHSAAALNGQVLNSGDVFSYNDAVGKRTEANGYLPAPAYVKGETVNEIGGGICQTSSTLYMATLLSNLEIVTRAAHRYAPAYISWGMDATVSWGGPEYRFRNNTDYPIKITTKLSGSNNLTITLHGTKQNKNTVKITNEVLGSTPFQEVRVEDLTLPAGTEKVKTTPYTGYQVRTYRNIYDGNGKLLSSSFEAASNYKARDRVILVGPPKPAEVPETPDSGLVFQPTPPPIEGTPTPPGELMPPTEGTPTLPEGILPTPEEPVEVPAL
ncbi:MAG: VanW family protein [Oscillospiraceae bacterium]